MSPAILPVITGIGTGLSAAQQASQLISGGGGGDVGQNVQGLGDSLNKLEGLFNNNKRELRSLQSMNPALAIKTTTNSPNMIQAPQALPTGQSKHPKRDGGL